jgi:hypothetical protein
MCPFCLRNTDHQHGSLIGTRHGFCMIGIGLAITGKGREPFRLLSYVIYVER